MERMPESSSTMSGGLHLGRLQPKRRATDRDWDLSRNGKAEEVIAYLDKLRLIVQYLGHRTASCRRAPCVPMSTSVREVGAEQFGMRTEMKNLNSFKAIARAIEGERARRSS